MMERRDGKRAWVRARRLRVVLTVAALCALSGAVAPALMSPAAAGADTGTTTFTYTGDEQQYAVPPGASAVKITTVGAPGGAIPDPVYGSIPGGFGAGVTATVPVAPGTTTLYVEVGGSRSWSCDGSAAAFNGGGSTPFVSGQCAGAGGGGASDVRTTSIATVPDSALTADNDSRLVVAAGGGGAGTCADNGFGVPAGGGSAGDSNVTGAGDGAKNDCDQGGSG